MGAIKYISNVGKSLAYTTIDVAKDLNPAFTSFVETNRDIGKIAYSSIRDFKKTTMLVGNKINEHEYTGYVKTTFKSLFKELKSGKWYDKEKIEALDSAAAEAFINEDNPFLTDDGDEFDTGDGDSFDSSDSSEFLADSIDEVGSRSSEAISTAILKSAEAQSKFNASMHEESKSMSVAMYHGMRTDLGTINLNLANLLQFGTEVLQPHAQNSTQFYEVQTNLMTETRDILKEMLEMQKKAADLENRRSSSDNMTVTDILDANGMLDISSLGKFLRNRADNMTGGALSSLSMIKDIGLLDQITQNLMQFITKALVSGAVSPALKKSFETLNKTVSGVAMNAILKMTDWQGDGNFIKRFLGETFGLDESVRDKYSLSGYNKGQTVWTGKDHKALTEVIPTLLSSINANLGGKDMRYNYETGKFVSKETIKKSKDDMMTNAAQRSAQDIYYHTLDPQIRKISWKSEDQEKLFREQLNKVIEYNFKHTKTFNPDEMHDPSKYGIDVGNAEENEKIMRRIEEMWRKAPISDRMAYAENLVDSMKYFNRQIRDLEESGDSVYNALFNDSDSLVADTPIANAVASASKQSSTVNHRKAKKQRRKNLKDKAKNTNNNKTTTQSVNLTDWDQMALDRAKQDNPEYFNEDGSLKSGYELVNGSIQKIKGDRKNPLGAGLSSTLDFVQKPVTDFVNLMAQGIYNVFFPKNSEDSEEMDMSFTQKIAYAMNTFAKDKTSALRDYFEDYFGTFRDFFKEKLDKIKDSEIVSGFRGGVKEGFANIGRYIKDSILGVSRYAGVTEEAGEEDKALADELAEVVHSEATGGKVITMPGLNYLRSYASGGVVGESYPYYSSNKKGNRGFLKVGKKIVPIRSYASGSEQTVEETGLAVVSKGETVVPGDHNEPKAASKRMNDEIDALEQVMSGEQAEDVVFSSAWNTVVEDQKDYSKLLQLMKANKYFKKWIQSDKEKVYIVERISAKLRKDKFLLGKNMSKEAKKGFSVLKSNAADVINQAREKIPEDDESAFKKNVSGVMDEMKKQYPNMVTGGLVGTGVSLLTGAIGGPLLGAAAGAGIGLLANSKKVQTMLFGEEVVETDEDGNKTKTRKGGLLPSTISNLITKYAPSMAKGATVGAITSIMPFVPGGPLAGIMVGSAIGFAAQNEELRNKIFGTLLGEGATEKEFQNKLRRVLPKMGLGALAGLVVGPFGPATNILLGSALGFATDTNAFKNAFFGEEVEKIDEETGKKYKVREGGLLGPIKEAMVPLIKDNIKWLKEKVQTPIERLISPLGVQIKQMFRTITGVFTGLANRIFQHMRDKMPGTLLGRALDFVGGTAAKIAKLPVNAFGAITTGIGNKLRRHQLRVGTAYEVKGLETAEARNAERKQIHKGLAGLVDRRFLNLDTALESMDPEQVQALYDAQRAVNDTDKFTKDQTLKQRNKINSALKKRFMSSIAKKTKVKIRDLAAAGNYKEAIEIINTLDIKPEDKDKLVQEVANASNKIAQLQDPSKLVDSSKSVIQKFLKSNGVDGRINSKLLERILKSEVDAFEGQKQAEEEAEKEQIPEVIRDNTEKIVDLLSGIKIVLEKQQETASNNIKNNIADDMETVDEHGNQEIDQQIKGNSFTYKVSEDNKIVRAKVGDEEQPEHKSIKEVIAGALSHVKNALKNNHPKKYNYRMMGGRLVRTKISGDEEQLDTTNAETRDAINDAKEDEQEEKESRKSIKESILGIVNRFRKKDKEDEEGEKTGKTGIFGTLLKFFTGGSSTAKALKIGAAGLIGISIADKLGLTDKLRDAANWLIETGIPKFTAWMSDVALPKLIDAMGGLATLITNGAEVVFGKLLPALVPAIITSLPDIAGSIVKGLSKLPGAIADAITGKKDSNTYWEVQTVGDGKSSALSAISNGKSSIKKTVNGVSMDYTVSPVWRSVNTNVSSKTTSVDGYMGSTTTSSKSSNKAIADTIKNGVQRDSSLPAAFKAENSNDAVYAKVSSTYDSIANNTVTVNGMTMTVNDLLNSDMVVGTVTSPSGETVEVRGYELLQYPQLAQEYGIDATLTDEMKDAQQKNLGIQSSEVMLAKRLGLSVAEGIANPKSARRVSKVLSKTGSGLSTVGKALGKHKSKALNFITRPLRPVSWVAKPAGKLATGASKGFSAIENLGYKVRGLDIPTSVSEAVTDTAGYAIDDIGAGLADEVPTKKTSVFQSIKDEFTTKNIQNAALENGLDDLTDASKSQTMRSKIATKAKDLGSTVLAKADNATNGKVINAINSATEAKGKVASKAKGLASSAKTKVDDVVGAGKNMLKSQGAKLANSASNSTIVKWAGKIQAWFSKLMGNSKILSYFSKVAKETGEQFSEKALNEAVEKVGKKLAQYFIQHGMKKAGTAVAKIAASAASAGIAAVAIAVYGFISGYRNANTIMGVTEMPNTACRVACGLVQALNETFLLGLVPLDLVFSLIWSLLKMIFPSLEDSNLEQARKEAQEELDRYNAEHGTDLTMEEYNKKDRWTTKAWNAVKDTASRAWDATKEFGSKAAKYIADKTTGGAFDDDTVREKLGLNDDVEVTLTDRAAVFLGNVSNNLFGVDATKQVNSVLLAAKNAPSAINNVLGGAFGFTDEDGNPVSLTEGVKGAISGAISTVGNGIDSIKESISEKINGAIDAVSGVWTIISDTFTDFKETIKEGLKTAVENVDKTIGGLFGFTDEDGEPIGFTTAIKQKFNSAKNTIAKFWNSLGSYSDEAVAKRNATTGKGSGLLAGRGSGIGGKGFISQLDPKYTSKSFSGDGDTIGEAGCGPASAAMAINSYNANSRDLTLNDTAKHAVKYKVRNDGVTPDYFADEFARSGLSTEYINGSRSDLITSAINSNNPVVLMGADSTNTSKRKSPFGPNNHYVVAKGTSKDGSMVYIDDPEASRGHIAYPTSKIVNSTKLAMAPFSARGTKISSAIRRKLVKFGAARGAYGPDTPQYKVWTRLRGAGYNEYAVAGAMGNIHHESGGFNSSAIEKGNGGAGFGLCQWSYGRRDQLTKFASARGVDPTNLDIQIDFLLAELDKNTNDPNVSYQLQDNKQYGFTADQWINATDISTATQAFCRCFERPQANCGMDERIKWAQTYYQEFTGTPGVVGDSTYSSSSGDTTTTDTSSTTSSGGNILTRLMAGIDNMAAAFGLTDSSTTEASTTTATTSSDGSSTGTVYSQADANGIAGNVSAVPTMAEKQKQLVAAMKSVEGKLKYSQAEPRDPDQGQADCSSTVNWAYKKVLGVDVGNTTRAQRLDPDTYTVATNLDDENKLQLGDLLLRDGHVEMYYGPGQMIGHGGPGAGPTVKTLGKHPTGKPYDLVRRWVGFRNDEVQVADTQDVAASGSGLKNRGARGSELSTNPLGSTVESISDTTSTTRTTNATSSATPQTNINVTQQSDSALIQAVLKIVQNTAYLQQVVALLTQLVALGGTQQSVQPGMTDDEKQAILNNSKEIANTKASLAKLLSDTAKQGNSTGLDSLISAVEGLAVQ